MGPLSRMLLSLIATGAGAWLGRAIVNQKGQLKGQRVAIGAAIDPQYRSDTRDLVGALFGALLAGGGCWLCTSREGVEVGWAGRWLGRERYPAAARRARGGCPCARFHARLKVPALA